MKRKIAVFMLCVTFAFGLMACSNKAEENKTEDTTAVEDQTAAEEGKTELGDEVVKDGTAEDKMEAEDTTGTEQGEAATEETMTGTLEENSGFMFTLISDADQEAYVFPLADDQKVLLDGISKGDKLTISFTGGVPTPDNVGTVVTNVVLAQ